MCNLAFRNLKRNSHTSQKFIFEIDELIIINILSTWHFESNFTKIIFSIDEIIIHSWHYKWNCHTQFEVRMKLPKNWKGELMKTHKFRGDFEIFHPRKNRYTKIGSEFARTIHFTACHLISYKEQLTHGFCSMKR